MNCDNYHGSGQDPRCPWCVVRVLARALETLDPENPALTPAWELLKRAQQERRAARESARST